MSNNDEYIPGDYETQKFAHLKRPYYEGLEIIKGLDYEVEDYIHHFPCFVGSMTLARFLTLYEVYKSTLGLAGHIADVGIYKGASMMFFAKLLQIHEPYTP